MKELLSLFAVVFLVFGCSTEEPKPPQFKVLYQDPKYNPANNGKYYSVIGDVVEYRHDLLRGVKFLSLFLKHVGGTSLSNMPRDEYIVLANAVMPSGIKLKFGKTYRFVFKGFYQSYAVYSAVDIFNRRQMEKMKEYLSVTEILLIEEVYWGQGERPVEFKEPNGR